jgi:hypothetical protein
LFRKLFQLKCMYVPCFDSRPYWFSWLNSTDDTNWRATFLVPPLYVVLFIRCCYIPRAITVLICIQKVHGRTMSVLPTFGFYPFSINKGSTNIPRPFHRFRFMLLIIVNTEPPAKQFALFSL